MSSGEKMSTPTQPRLPLSTSSLQPQDLRPWEALLTLHNTMLRIRLCREPGANLHMLLTAAVPVVGAETLAWLPAESHLPFACAGNVPWTPGNCTRLLTLISREHDWGSQPTYIANQPEDTGWHHEFPQVHQILALQLYEQQPLGWLVAINKTGGNNFRRTDAALLTPFLGLLRFYHHSTARLQETQELLLGFARSLVTAIDAKDPRRLGHSERTARIAVAIARHLSLSDTDLGEVYLAGLLHDIGKLGLPDTLLRKPGPWSDEELRRFRQHVNIGYTFLADLHMLRNVLPAILHHHEYYDGSGYPDGLQGEQIPLLARLVAVADAYDALSTGYYDIQALSIGDVEKQLVRESGKKWDPRIVEALLRAREDLLAIKPGSVGQSFFQHMDQALHNWGSFDQENFSIANNINQVANELCGTEGTVEESKRAAQR